MKLVLFAQKPKTREEFLYGIPGYLLAVAPTFDDIFEALERSNISSKSYYLGKPIYENSSEDAKIIDWTIHIEQESDGKKGYYALLPESFWTVPTCYCEHAYCPNRFTGILCGLGAEGAECIFQTGAEPQPSIVCHANEKCRSINEIIIDEACDKNIITREHYILPVFPTREDLIYLCRQQRERSFEDEAVV